MPTHLQISLFYLSTFKIAQGLSKPYDNPVNYSFAGLLHSGARFCDPRRAVYDLNLIDAQSGTYLNKGFQPFLIKR
jgi:hypothetical protein